MTIAAEAMVTRIRAMRADRVNLFNMIVSPVYVHKGFGAADHGDKSKAFLGIEPFNKCFHGFSRLRVAVLR